MLVQDQKGRRRWWDAARKGAPMGARSLLGAAASEAHRGPSIACTSKCWDATRRGVAGGWAPATASGRSGLFPGAHEHAQCCSRGALNRPQQ